MSQQFINREKELGFLDTLWKENEAQFLVLYGRRRVGKTELTLKFAEKKPSVYFLAEKSTDEMNRKGMRNVLADFLKDEVFRKAEFETWEELFREFSKKVTERFVLVMDEFPFMIESNKAIPSVFQKVWDMYLSKTKVFLILAGSSISMMETEVLGTKSPLYGRRTAQWKLMPFDYEDIRGFFPSYSNEQLINTFGALDGIPHYLNQFDKDKTPLENIKDKILSKGRLLHEEAEILLKEEMREPHFYFSILHAISAGNSTFGEIVNHTGLDKTLVSKYLSTLQKIHVVDRIYPVTSRKPKPRKGLYEISDNYFRFWFRFVYPYMDLLQKSPEIPGFDKDFSAYMGKVFEGSCIQFLKNLNEEGRLPFRFTKIGRWWEKGEEIDIVCLGRSDILLCEVKWSSLSERDVMRILKKLKEKAELVGKGKKHFCVIAKKVPHLTIDNVLIFSVDDMFRFKNHGHVAKA